MNPPLNLITIEQRSAELQHAAEAARLAADVDRPPRVRRLSSWRRHSARFRRLRPMSAR